MAQQFERFNCSPDIDLLSIRPAGYPATYSTLQSQISVLAGYWRPLSGLDLLNIRPFLCPAIISGNKKAGFYPGSRISGVFLFFILSIGGCTRGQAERNQTGNFQLSKAEVLL